MTELAEEKAVESKETLLQFLEDNADPALRPMLSKLANEAEYADARFGSSAWREPC